MYEESDTVQLISSKSLPSRNGKAKRDFGDEEMNHFSDSELSKAADKDDDEFEETTVFSDSLYGDSLPSMRAQLAATQMQHRKRKKQHPEKNEKELLLAKHEGDEKLSISMKDKKDDTHGLYDSLGGNIVPKRKPKKEMLKKL